MVKKKSKPKRPGLWANIHAKRKRGDSMRKKGAKGAPTESQMRSAKRASKRKKR